MTESTEYFIHLDPKYGYLELVDVPALIEACEQKWYNQTLCEVNDSVVRLGILEGEFHWHKHDREDEFFFVLEGQLLIDVGDETVSLAIHQGYTIPMGVVHRTRAPERTVILMMEKGSVTPTGDEETPLQRSKVKN
jgi:mannose-6-phosphate isomerase-like protein (cupin superfamily)